MTYCSYQIGGTFRRTDLLEELIKLIAEVCGEEVKHVSAQVALSWQRKITTDAQSDYDGEETDALDAFLNDHTLPYSKYTSNDGYYSTTRHNYDGKDSEFTYNEDNDGDPMVSIYTLKEWINPIGSSTEFKVHEWVKNVERPCPPIVLEDECESWGAVELAKIAHGVAA